MGKAYEKAIQAAQQEQANTGKPPSRTEPMGRGEVESFVKGFGMSAAATKRIVGEWMADQERARDAGRESHADSVYYDEH